MSAMATTGDGELLGRTCEGDREAFLQLYRRHHGAVFGYGYRMLGSVEQAEDLCHETFLALLRHPERYDSDRAELRTFLLAIARNLSLKQLRRNNGQGDPEVLQKLVTGEPRPDERLADSEVESCVRQAVLALTPVQREVIILFEYQDCSIREIAALTGVDEGAVRARLFRARQALRRSLAPLLADQKPEN